MKRKFIKDIPGKIKEKLKLVIAKRSEASDERRTDMDINGKKTFR
jgi:hypothetical protein